MSKNVNSQELKPDQLNDQPPIDKAARSPKFHVTRNPVYDNVIGLYGRQKINS